MKKYLMFFMATLAVCSAFADDHDKYDGLSLTVYGVSKHMEPNTVDPYNEVNPGVGIRKHLGDCFWQTANCFVGLGYIDKNSVDGRVVIASAGSKWTLFTSTNGYRFHTGATVDYVRYQNARKNITYSGFAPVPFIGFGRGPMDVDVSILSRSPLKALTGKDSKAAFLFYVNYNF